MTIFENSNIHKDKFLDRCVTLKKYIITFYVEDMQSAEEIYNEIIEYYENIDYESEIDEIVIMDKITIVFRNGSVINIITKEDMIPEIHSNVVFADNRFSKFYLQNTVKPRIYQYEFNDDFKMLNPNPIFIKFPDEEKDIVQEVIPQKIQNINVRSAVVKRFMLYQVADEWVFIVPNVTLGFGGLHTKR